jgi:hypothetical protein
MTRQSRNAREVTEIAKTPEEMQRVRNQITNVIADEAVEVVQSLVRGAKKGGNVSTLKYLLQVAGLFPAAVGEEREPESLRDALVRQLGLSPKQVSEEGADEGNVES